MYVVGRGGGRRARRKLSDENANSFLAKEEKAWWCKTFASGGRETAAYGSCNPCEGEPSLMQAVVKVRGGSGSFATSHEKQPLLLNPNLPPLLGWPPSLPASRRHITGVISGAAYQVRQCHNATAAQRETLEIQTWVSVLSFRFYNLQI